MACAALASMPALSNDHIPDPPPACPAWSECPNIMAPVALDEDAFQGFGCTFGIVDYADFKCVESYAVDYSGGCLVIASCDPLPTYSVDLPLPQRMDYPIRHVNASEGEPLYSDRRRFIFARSILNYLPQVTRRTVHRRFLC